MANFEIKQVYSFEVYPVPILGNNFKNVTVLAIMDQESANQLIDTNARHINVYPFLPAGTPNNPGAYNYVKVKSPAGIISVLGLAWIKPETIELIESRTISVKIENVSASDAVRVRNALVQNGFNAITIDVE